MYVRPFPGPGGNGRFRAAADARPGRATKSELFYGLNGQIMVAAFTVEGRFVPCRETAALVGRALPDARNKSHVRSAS